MKRYWVFACPYYYPNGGMGDLEGTFDTWEECLLHIDEEYGESNEWCRDKDDYLIQIFDSKKHERYTLDDEEIVARYVYSESYGFVNVSEKKERA